MPKKTQLLIDGKGARENAKLLTEGTESKTNEVAKDAILSVMGTNNEMPPSSIYKGIFKHFEVKMRMSKFLNLLDSLCDEGIMKKTDDNSYIVPFEE